MKTTHNRLKTVPAAIKAEEAKQAAEAAELAKRNPQPATAPPRRGVGLDDALGRDDWVQGGRTPGGGLPQLRWELAGADVGQPGLHLRFGGRDEWLKISRQQRLLESSKKSGNSY